MGKICNRFQTKTAQKPYMLFIKEYPPPASTPRCNLFTSSTAKCYGKESSNMAASSTSVDPATSDVSEEIPPWARGNHLRYVEKEVLIPKIVRERAKAKCDDLVKGKQYRHYNRCHQGQIIWKLYVTGISSKSLETVSWVGVSALFFISQVGVSSFYFIVEMEALRNFPRALEMERVVDV